MLEEHVDEMVEYDGGGALGESGVFRGPLTPVIEFKRGGFVALCLLVAALYAANVSSAWWIGYDNGLYLNLARNLARGEGFTLNGEHHTMVPPAFPAFLAALMLAGARSFLAINIAMNALGLAALALQYLLVRQVVRREWAIAVTAMVALSYEMVGGSGETLSDVPFVIPAAAGLALYYRGLLRRGARRAEWEMGAILLVSACWVRAAAIPLAVGAAAGLVLSAPRSARPRAILSAALVMAGLAISWVALQDRGHAARSVAPAATYVDSIRAVGLADASHVFGNLCYAAEQLSRSYFAQPMPSAASAVVLVFPLLVGLVRRILSGDRIGPTAVLFYVGGVSTLGLMRARYFLPVTPLLVVYLLEGWWFVMRRMAGLSARAVTRTVTILLAVMILMNLPLVGQLIYRRHKCDVIATDRYEKWQYVLPVVAFLKRQPPGGAVFAAQPVSYLADIPAPKVAKSIETSAPDDQTIGALLEAWNIRYVVVSRGDESAFRSALRKYLAARGKPVFTFNGTDVYRAR